MLKIVSISFKYLRGEAHYQYLTLFDQSLTDYPAVKALISSLYPEFSNLLAQEKQTVDIQKSSYYTQQIAEADHRNDRLITGINETVKAALHHFDPAVVAAAQSLMLRLKAFGNIQSKSYEEEAAAISILVNDMQSPEFMPKVALLGLTSWVNELAAAVADFDRLLRLRNIELSGKPHQRLSDIRKQIEQVYRSMITHINAAAVIDTTNVYTEFINRMNTLIAYFNEHNRKPVPKNIRTAVVSSIPSQKYTGKAITPIPVVHLNEVELFFAKDFKLAYRNNIQHGVADVIITGKGVYAGKKTVTFNID